MRVFLAGVGCVGKTAIGARLAKRLDCPFHDLDSEVERHFGKPIERLRAEAPSPHSFRRQFASVVLANLLQSAGSDFVMALTPSGLMDSMWGVLKKLDRVVVLLQDSPENILSRITFYDAESKPIVRTLTQEERHHYLREISNDAKHLSRSFRKADLRVEINGLDIEASAANIERRLREWRDAEQRAASARSLSDAVDIIRGRVAALGLSKKADVWSTILKQIKKKQCFDHRYAEAIINCIGSLLAKLDDKTVIAMWRETETGMADQMEDKELVPDCVRMDLEMGLLEAVTESAYEEAKG
jgi:shikimate kinase